MNSVRSNNQSMKYQVFTPSGLQDIGIIKFEFVAKTQFLSNGDISLIFNQYYFDVSCEGIDFSSLGF